MVKRKENHEGEGSMQGERDTSEVDLPVYSYTIQEEAFYNIISYTEITG
jgi:hypothetical protein